jgi:hypothetical protein
MATIIDLGKKVKAKYPGVYDDMDDLEVGRKVKTKYPQAYSDFTEIEKPKKKEPKKKGFLERASGAGEATFGKAAQFLFGSTGKTVGGLITSGIGSTATLMGKKDFGKKLEKQAGEAITPGNIAFTALELYPGGGQLSKTLRKVPGASSIVTKLDDVLKILPKKQQAKAVKLYTEALAPTTRETKAITKRIVPKLLERGEKAGFLSGLSKIGSKAKSQTTNLGSKIDDLIDALPETKKIQLGPVLKSIDSWSQKYIVKGVKVNPKAVKMADGMADMFKQFGDELDVANLRKVRQVLDESINLGKGFTNDAITKLETRVQKTAADTIRAEFAKELPELDKINKQFSFWRGVDDVVSKTLERKAPQTGFLRKGIGASIGAKIGSAFGVAGAGSGAVVGSKVSQALGSAAWKTRSAIWRNNFANAVIKGQTEKVLMMMKTLGVVTKNEIDNLLKK